MLSCLVAKDWSIHQFNNSVVNTVVVTISVVTIGVVNTSVGVNSPDRIERQYLKVPRVVRFVYSGRIGVVTEYPDIDYLAVGHVTLDLAPSSTIPGGTVTFAARAAQALGCRVAVLTSAASDLDLDAIFPGMATENVPSLTTTTFQNTYRDNRRQQKIFNVAAPIHGRHVPSAWARSPIVHLGPIANEIDSSMVGLFSNSSVGLTPQGWFRRWDEDGHVSQGNWPDAYKTLPLAAAVVLSREDLGDPSELDEYVKRARLLVLTEQASGCTVYCREEVRHFPVPLVAEVNPTGAGDIFAAAFFIRLHQTHGNPWEAAEFANRVAAASVTQEHIEGKIQAISEIARSGGFSFTS